VNTQAISDNPQRIATIDTADSWSVRTGHRPAGWSACEELNANITPAKSPRPVQNFRLVPRPSNVTQAPTQPIVNTVAAPARDKNSETKNAQCAGSNITINCEPRQAEHAYLALSFRWEPA
jgi:hypothetical protein